MIDDDDADADPAANPRRAVGEDDVEGPEDEFSRGEVLITRAIKPIAEDGNCQWSRRSCYHQRPMVLPSGIS